MVNRRGGLRPRVPGLFHHLPAASAVICPFPKMPPDPGYTVTLIGPHTVAPLC
jgi:hypothetical protein